MTYPRAFAFVLSLGAVGCSGLLQPDDRPLHGTVALSRSVAQASTPIVGTYRSVVDSLALSVTAGGRTQTIGHRFLTGEASVNLPITLPSGVATLSADVLSNNRTRLFSGSTTSSIAGDGFSIVMPLAALTPVLVVFPDTLKLDSIRISTVTLRFASVTVHNSGTDSLSWNVALVSTNPTGVCGLGCPIVPTSGMLLRDGEVKLKFTMPAIAVGGVPNTTATVNYLFTSKEGTVPLQWRFPAGP